MDLKFRTLRADEIEVREGNKTKDGTKKTLLLYKDARVDMSLLDEVVGPMNWKREHTRDNANCIVSIWDEDKKQWISKEDTGTDSRTEAEKGRASDSFKRACFNWGIGRELYTAPAIFVDANVSTYDLRVSEITYNANREIVALVILGKRGDVVFSTENKMQAPAAPVQTKGGAIYPAKDPVNEAAQDEYTSILADIDAAESMEQLKATMAEDCVQKSPYLQAIRQAANGTAKRKGWV